MQKKSRDSINIFRNELELVCLVIEGGGGISDYLFFWGGGGGRGYTVDVSRNLGSYIFHRLRENPVEKHLGHAFHVNSFALVTESEGE